MKIINFGTAIVLKGAGLMYDDAHFGAKTLYNMQNRVVVDNCVDFLVPKETYTIFNKILTRKF